MRKYRLNHLIICFISFSLAGRSVHRLTDPLIPEMRTKWIDDKKSHCLRSFHLTYNALFNCFDLDYIHKHSLPQSIITFRQDPSKSCLGSEISKIIENVSFIVTKCPTDLLKYSEITIITDRNFEYRTGTGALIFRLKHYPFIVKFFRETPLSFSRPFKQGFDQKGIFVNGGGINRYLAGSSRIKNLYFVKNLIADLPRYRNLVDFPRKWFYIPNYNRWFELTAYNVCCNTTPIIHLPSIYCIVVDAIEVKRIFSFNNKKDRHWAVTFAKATQEHIDPHIDNFIREKNTNKIIVIDTEDFWLIGGLSKPLNFHNYAGYYLKMACKYICNNYFVTRKEHIAKAQCSFSLKSMD